MVERCLALGPPVPGQGSAPPHYLLLQSLLHPSTHNRDYRPSTVSNCSDSRISWTLSPTPHSSWPTPPLLPVLKGDCLLPRELGSWRSRCPKGWGTMDRVAKRTLSTTHGWPAEFVKEKSQSLMGRDLGVCLAPFLIQCHSVFLVFASLCLQAASAVSASLSQAALPPPPEHTWLLTSDNPTTTAPLSPTLLPAAPSSPLALFLPLLPHLEALRLT